MTDTKQPEALRLAEWLATSGNTNDQRAATALRCLHEVNAELLEALKDLMTWYVRGVEHWDTPTYNRAKDVIAKAEVTK